MTVMRVPAYSPQAVAEHAAALMLTLNRKIHHAYNRVREGNFELNGLVGFNMTGKTVGIVGHWQSRHGVGPHHERVRLQIARLRHL